MRRTRWAVRWPTIPKRVAEAHWASDGDMVRTAYSLRPEDDDWGQAGTLVREVLDDAARERLAHNIIGHVSDGVKEPVLSRVFEYWTQRRRRVWARRSRRACGPGRTHSGGAPNRPTAAATRHANHIAVIRVWSVGLLRTLGNVWRYRAIRDSVPTHDTSGAHCRDGDDGRRGQRLAGRAPSRPNVPGPTCSRLASAS